MFVYGPPAWIEWKDVRWYYDHRMGRYRDRNGIMLAQAVWADANGAIPTGYDVHHVNEDRTDDRLANLALVARHDHRRSHARANGAKASASAGRRGAAAMWAQREPQTYTCLHCGADFESKATYASYCSDAHRAAYYRRQRRIALGIE